MDPEMIVIGDVTSQGAIPSMESGSANEASTYYPTKKQIESNNLNRFIENASNIGSGASVAYATTVFASDTSSEGVTATIQVGNAIGNLLGLIVGPLVHLFARKYYRTGEYNVKVGAARPKEEVISEMPKGEVLIYQDQEKLHYLVKGVGKSVVEGEIEEAELGLIFCDELYKLSSGLKRNSTLLLAPKSKLAFLKYTAKKGHTYSGKTSLNPLYRTYRTLSKAGGQAGVIISYFLSGEDRNKQRLISYILSNAIAVLVGIFAFPYWLVREKILKIPPNTPHKYDLTALEGWSKYARTAQAIGTSIGQAVGGLVIGAAQNATAAATSFSIAFWGGIVGIGSFILGVVGVPLINWISSKFTKNGRGILASESKNGYRNNYTRSGLILGAAIGACLGLFIGNWAFGLMMAGTIFSALGSVIGGLALSIYGHKIHKKLHPLPPGKTEADEDIENSWDYVSRSSASVFGYIGAAVVCVINPAAALLLAPIGAAIASGLGWCLGILIMRRARQLPGNEAEKKADTLPWTQRITMGANIGSIIGSAIGVGVGFAGFVLAGPAGLILAVSLFGAIGAVIGGVWGALYDRRARDLIFDGIKSLFRRNSKTDESQSRRDLTQRSTPLSTPSISRSLSSSVRSLPRVPVDLQDAPLQPSSPYPTPLIRRVQSESNLARGPGLFSPPNNDARSKLHRDRGLSTSLPASRGQVTVQAVKL